MKAGISLVAVLALIGLALLGIEALEWYKLFGVFVPYAAIVLFLSGFVYGILRWAKSPVPFRIPTTCGQQKSLRWIKQDKLDNPSNGWQALGRMLLEILFFRSLFRNTRTSIEERDRVVYGPTKWLWLGGLVFHWSFLIVFIRHLRFFSEPAPFFVGWIESLDGFLQVGVPVLYATSIALLLAVTYLVLRRLFIPQVRYISLINDYFPLFLILGIGTTGFLLRHFVKTDIIEVKKLALGLVGFNPVAPESIHWLFYAHLFLVCLLFAYFPFSKLMHMPGVFMSPTRNLANNNRAVRHTNPWNAPVEVHTYGEYEDEFRDKMVKAGIPVDQQPEPGADSGEKEGK